MNVYRLLISCKDTRGLVAIVSEFIAKHNGNIIEANHHLDINDKYFFMRIEIEAKSLNISFDEFNEKFKKFAKEKQLWWQLNNSAKLKKMLIMCSKSSHCVADLLHRNFEKELEAEVVGVLSNHHRLSYLSKLYKVPFACCEVAEMAKEVDKYQADVIVLARYMQIIPSMMCEKYKHKIINIHHSFLPSFVGGKPYQQAANKGVKLIGATCHFVTKKLDDGAIIEQAVERVSHNNSADDMRKIGQDIEKITLYRGLKAYLEDRIIVHNNKTIVFN